MSIHRKDFNAMTLNDLRQLLIDQAVEYNTKHHMPKYNALKQAADYLYWYSKGQGLKLPHISNYRERVFSFIFGDNSSLTTEEFSTACRYFLHPLRNKHYDKSTFDEYNKALEAFRAYVKELEEKTAELRMLDNSCYPISILNRIEDYIELMHIEETEELLIYTSVYNIGRVDGIRDERARRRAKTAPTGEEATA